MNLITIISVYSILAPILFGAFLYRKISFELRLLVFLVVFLGVMEFTSIEIMNKGSNNLPLFHLYTFVEFTIIYSVYKRLAISAKWQGVLKFSALLFFAFSILNLVFWEGIFEFNSNQRYLETVLVFIYCAGFFFELMKRAELLKISAYPYFWLTSGYLVYFAGTFFLFLFSKDILKITEINYYAIIHGVLNILLNLIYVITLWLGSKRSVQY